MDRRTVFYGQLPREVDWLAPQQFANTANGMLAESLIGTAGAFDGLAVGPAFPTSMSVIVGRGAIYQSTQIESSAWSSLPIDTRPIVKQGLLLDATALTLVAPTTFGFAQKVLIQARFEEIDDGLTLLPYYNADNPSQPFAGPGNNNQRQTVNRLGIVRINAKYGIPATSGQEATPAPDAGWLGISVVTLAQGQSTIAGASIAEYAPAQKIRAKLLDLPYAVQDNRWNYAVDSGLTGSSIVATLFPAPQNCNDGFGVRIKLGHDLIAGATLSVNGFSGAIVRPSGKAMASGDGLAGDVVHFTRNNGQWVAGGFSPATDPSAPVPVTVLTGNIVKTVGGSAPDFADLNAAFIYASSVRIPFGSSLTFQIRAGKYTYNQSVRFSHPDGARIFVLGAPLTNPVPPATSLNVSGSSASQRSTDTASALSTLRASYATELYFIGGAQFFIAGDLGNAQDLLLTSDGNGSNLATLLVIAGTQLLTRLSSVGGQSFGANFLGCNTTLAGIGHYLGCGSVGLRLSNNGNLQLGSDAQFNASSNGYAGVQVSGGAVFNTVNKGAGGPVTYARGNGSYGCDNNTAIAIFTDGSQFVSNGISALFSSNPGILNASACTASGSPYSIIAQFFTSVNFDSGTASATLIAYRADNMSFINRANATTSAPTVASPAVGSYGGGNNSFIS